MKKYKIHFSIFNLFADSQAEVVKLQTYVKGFTVMLAGTTWYASDANSTLIVGCLGFICDAILHCLYLEEVK